MKLYVHRKSIKWYYNQSDFTRFDGNVFDRTGKLLGMYGGNEIYVLPRGSQHEAHHPEGDNK